ncbi:hypothetical protein G6F57_016445 [Rhizopus arrhizus]|nr:hypothetical protein G6F57_016445 [Rhizopus arrhizus]
MLQYPKFDPIALQIGPLAIHWYGLMYLAGFARVYLLGRRRITSGHTTSLNVRDLEDLIFYSVLGVVLGGRLGRHVVSRRPDRRDPGDAAVRAQEEAALFRGQRLHRPADPAGPGFRPAGQLHQWRAVGPADRRAVGHGVSRQRRRAGAPPLPTL